MESIANPSFSYDTKEIIEKIEETRANKIYIQEKLSDFKKKYPDQFIAIYKRRLIGHDSDPKLLIKFLKSNERYKNKIEMIMIEFISGEDYYLIL